MSQFDEALATSVRRSGQPLMVDVILKELNAVDKKSFEAALRDKKYSTGQITRALRSMGYTISTGAINNWRTRNGVV